MATYTVDHRPTVDLSKVVFHVAPDVEPPASVTRYLNELGWVRTDAKFSPPPGTDAPFAYYTWGEALAYELFTKFHMGVFRG